MSEYLYRRNAVMEALAANRRTFHRLWIQRGLGRIETVVAAAKSRHLPIETSDKRTLSQLAGDSSHQGVVLEAGPYRYSDVEEILNLAASAGEQPFLLVLDLLHGPQNIGVLLRTAEICGVHGVIVQDRRAPDITPSVVIYSAGAAEHLRIAQVTNLVQTMKQLQAADIWMVGLDLVDDAKMLGQVDLNMAMGIVVGHEGQGLRRLVRENCDFLLKLPMRGNVTSLNAATAGSVLLYAAWEARGFSGAKSHFEELK